MGRGPPGCPPLLIFASTDFLDEEGRLFEDAEERMKDEAKEYDHPSIHDLPIPCH